MIQTVERKWLADVEAMRRDFAHDLDNDGIPTDAANAVINACWAEGVREPYFELQDEDETDWLVTS